MKTHLLILTAILALAAGCFTPKDRQAAADEKVAKAKNAIEKNDDKIERKGVGYTYAGDYSLSLDPTPSPFSKLAKEMTERSLVATGLPEMQEILELRSIVRGLLSTNVTQKAQAEKDLAARDQEVVKLQAANKNLEDKLQVAEQKRDEVSKENAEYATKWKKMTGWIKKILWGVGILFALRFACIFLPPPYNMIGSVVDTVFGGLGKMVFKMMPAAKQAAGVVSEEAHITSEKTLEKLVGAIQDFRDRKKQASTTDPVLSELDTLLNHYTDAEVTRPKIIEVKKNLKRI